MKNGIAERSRSILLLHDLQATREAIERLLNKDGYRVYGASDEASAIDRAQCHCPDLIIVSLGGLLQRSISEAQSIRKKAGLDVRTPIVVLSSSSVIEGAELHIGDSVCVTLPDDFNQFRALLARLLARTAAAG
jgi:DNA-binding response OmpR family regulator